MIDSIRVTDLNPSVTPPDTDEHVIYRKIAGNWTLMTLKRKVNGVWVNQRVKRIDTT